ncbi:hypothetical protein LX64_01638 [Chitinophaga skermanii]|uniref:Contractile injection system tube protein N-terminal domain-containing protein n=1 Tax=Chitinophaga skermanii TaxID=331697 RepID=A0A327QQH6_9BACT|nr:hypothetical protein [Chitinophaga skermanii]RAJ06511.1 hypothetical protein LX64_01638 [Chitinophaga skermanii]
MASNKETANVEKIVIRPFLNQKQDKSAGGDFTIPINPENYSQSYKVEAKQKTTGGNQGGAPEYKFTAPEQLKLDFTLDNTGTIEGNILNGTEVREQVDKLLGTVYKMQGEAHKPAILKIQWGLFTFDCILTTLDINYVLFKPNGDPLRAKVSATFTQYTEPKKRVAKEDKHSPDLYRSVKVNDGDTLPLLCYKNYSDPNFYMQVAYFNGLVSVRDLKKDEQLAFPPINDTPIQPQNK